MTPGDAMRKGALQRPQAFQVLFYWTLAALGRGEAPSHSCAEGALWEGTFGAPGPRVPSMDLGLEAVYPQLRRVVRCPAESQCGGLYLEGALTANGRPVLTIVTHLNDTHRWTRERIADWLDTLESGPGRP